MASPAATEPSRGPTSSGNLTVPNAITVVRLLCIPLFVWLLFGRENRAAAAWLLGALGATDWVDGFLARRWHQVSELGKVLDPTADRMLLIVGVGSIIIDGSAPLWFSLAVIVRELLVGGTLLVLTAAGMQRFDVTWAGKAGTFGLMFAFPFFLASHSTLGWRDTALVLAYAFGLPGLCFSWWSAISYVPTARRALVEGRSRRRA